jgi:SAM-dependent methyltransferase
VRARADDPEIRAIAEETLIEAGELGREAISSPTEPVTTVLQVAGVGPFEVPAGTIWTQETKEILGGRYLARVLECLRGRRPRRILDVGAGVGAFALWASLGWPNAWIDVCEPDPSLADVCMRNLPLGACLLVGARPEDVPLLSGTYDIVRCTSLALLDAALRCVREDRGAFIADLVIDFPLRTP